MGILDAITGSIMSTVDWLRSNPLFASILFFAVLLMGTFVINSVSNVFLGESGYMCGFEFHDSVRDNLSMSNNSAYDGSTLYDSITSYNRGDFIYNATTDQMQLYEPNTWYSNVWHTMKASAVNFWAWIKGKFGQGDLENTFGQNANISKYNETIWGVLLRDYPPVLIASDLETYDFNEMFGFRCDYPDKKLTFWSIAIFDWKMWLLLVTFGYLITFSFKWYQYWFKND